MYENVVTGIVTYQPDIAQLQKNVAAVLANGLREIVIVDNGSANVDRLPEIECPGSRLEIIRNDDNLGIAKALNQIFAYAQSRGAEWVLTLDQDCEIFPSMMQTYARYMDRPDVASLTCLWQDRNCTLNYHFSGETEWITECITSGNLLRLDVWKQLGGFNERLFIDMVDSEFCYRMVEKGMKILRVNAICMLHAIGNTKAVIFLGKKRYTSNHSAFRRYYIARNGLYCLRRFPKVAEVGRKRYSFIPRTLIKILLFEDNKWKKTTRFLRGVIDGVVQYRYLSGGTDT